MLNQPAYVISGPSCSGKGSLISMLLEADRKLYLTRSWTTRSRRKNDGFKYRYVTEAEFHQAVRDGRLLENQEYCHHFYGTCIENAPSDAELLIEVDSKGALNLKKKYPDLVKTIFILPPSKQELERRLVMRNTESPEQMAQRLASAPYELKDAEHFDSHMENKDLQKAFTKLHFWILTHRRKMKVSPIYKDPFELRRIQSDFGLTHATA